MKTFYVLKGFVVGAGTLELGVTHIDTYDPKAFETLEAMKEAYRKRPAVAGGLADEYEWIQGHYDLGGPTLWAVRETKPTLTDFQWVGMEIQAESAEQALLKFSGMRDLL